MPETPNLMETLTSVVGLLWVLAVIVLLVLGVLLPWFVWRTKVYAKKTYLEVAELNRILKKVLAGRITVKKSESKNPDARPAAPPVTASSSGPSPTVAPKPENDGLPPHLKKKVL